MFTVGGLFSGLAMLEHAAVQLGGRLLWTCENDDYCRQVIAKRYPGVHCYPDVHFVGRGVVAEHGPVDLMVGGFPCQGISGAGKGLGLDDPRSGLWREFRRVIGEVRPKSVMIENVRNLLSKGGVTVVQDLLDLGYCVEWDVIPAAAVGACHLRERVWIVARLPEVVAGPVYGEPLVKKGERVEFSLDGKLPRAGRVDDSESVELVPIAPRKTRREGGWTYWTGVNLWGDEHEQMLWRTLHGTRRDEYERPQGPSGNELGNMVNKVESGQLILPSSSSRDWKDTGDGKMGRGQLAEAVRNMWPTPQHVDALGGRVDNDPSAKRPSGTHKTLSLGTAVRREQALLPTPDAYGNGNDPVNHMQKKADRCGGPITNLDVIARNGFAQPNGWLWPTTTITTDARGGRNETAFRPNGSGAHHAGTTLLDAMVREEEVEVVEDQDGSQEVRMWPTASAADGTGGPGTSPLREGGQNLRTRVASPGASLNPDWVCWLMSAPLGWADLTVPNEFLTQ